MQSVFGTRPDVKGCSRTDAGVHARRFALNFHYDGRIPVQRIPLALNARLPMDVRALAAQQVPDDFHARYAAHAKTYHYRLRCSAVDDPFDYETCHRVNGPLDLAAMQAAAAHFVGRHDFLALCASGSSAAAHGENVLVKPRSFCHILITGQPVIHRFQNVLIRIKKMFLSGRRTGLQQIPHMLKDTEWAL